MSTCELNIVLDDQEAVFRTGQPVTGRVLVHVHKDCRCRALTVGLHWKTKGEGIPTGNSAGGAAQAVIGQGRWRAGQVLEFPFSLTVPPGPVSYDGRVVGVEWELRARADIPMAPDPTYSIPVVVLPVPGQEFHDLGPLSLPPDAQPPTTSTTVAVYLGFGIFLLVLALATGIFMHLALRGQDSATHLVVLVVPGCIALTGMALLGVGMARRAATAGLGPPLLALEPNPVQRGGRLVLRIRLSPRQTVTLTRAHATLAGRERATQGSAQHQRTYQHEFFKESVELTNRSGVIPAGEERVLTCQFSIPRNAPPTFSARNNYVEWFVMVSLSVAQGMDWTDQRMVVVLPG